MRKKTNRRTGFRRIFGLLILILLAIVVSCTACSGTSIDSRIASVKDTVAQVADSIRSGDLDRISAAFAELDALVNEYHSLLTASPMAAAKWVPGYGEDVETVIRYMELWQEVYPDLIAPCLEKVQEIGLPNTEAKREESGDFVRQIRAYADLYDAYYSEMLAALDKFIELPAFHMEKISSRLEPYRNMAKGLRGLLPELEDLPDTLLRPCADMLERVPLSSMKSENGLHIDSVLQYMAFYNEIRPRILKLTETVSCADLSSAGPEMQAKLTETAAAAGSLLEQMDKYVTLAQSILGDGRDRKFLIVGQNSAELRAGGGFPGVVCVATIENGYAKLGDFSSSWVLLNGSFANVVPTRNERELFGPWFAQVQLKDATFNPHFPMVAKGWAYGHSYYFHTDVDGVISATPHIVQGLLSVCGPITLSNGTELTYDNCMQYLQHDIYYQYLARDTADLNTIVDGLASDEIVDALFEETAKTVMEKLLDKLEGHITLHDITRLMDVLEKSAANRTVMAWMADEQVEQQLKELGWSGSLNDDPQKPEIGVYFSVQDANKVGYFVDIEAICDDARAVRNEDGSVTWPVTVRLRNTLTKADLDAGKGNWYKLLGSYDGDISSIVHFFAPAGGRIENIAYTIPEKGDGQSEAAFPGLTEGEYEGLQVFYNTEFWLYPGEMIEFTYTVTTAPGVSVRPGFSMTPICSLKY